MNYLTELKEKYKLNIDDENLPFSFSNKHEAIKKVEKIWDSILNGKCDDAILTPALPRGNTEANIMIIGQNPAGRGKHHYTTIWTGKSNPAFLIKVTQQADIYKDSWFTNLVPYPTSDNKITNKQINQTLDLLKLQLDIIKPKILIGLGNIVNNTLKNNFLNQYKIIEAKHPTYIKRFFSGKSDKINEYIKVFENSKNFL